MCFWHLICNTCQCQGFLHKDLWVTWLNLWFPHKRGQKHELKVESDNRGGIITSPLNSWSFCKVNCKKLAVTVRTACQEMCTRCCVWSVCYCVDCHCWIVWVSCGKLMRKRWTRVCLIFWVYIILALCFGIWHILVSTWQCSNSFITISEWL